MEGQNILYGNVDDLMNVRGLVEARDKVRAEIDSLNNENIVSITQQEIADRFNISRPKVNRMIADLTENGYLKRTNRGRIVTEKAYEHLGISHQGSLF